MWLTLHHLAVCLVFVVSIDQLRLGDSVSFTNIGIKLCQHKCLQYGCESIRYNIETLTCHLSDMDSEQLMKETGHFVGRLQLPNVKACICTLDTCRGMRCLETRGGKTVCVKDVHHQAHDPAFVNTTLIDACWLGDLHQVKNILCQYPANINSRGQSDRTPAMIAAGAGNRALLELLVEKGANLSLLDDEDNSILHVACMDGNLEIVKYILSRNIIDIDSRGGNGTTPLMSAALFGKKEVFRFLLETGADISKEDDYGENTLHVSCKGGNLDIVKCVLTRTVVYINSTDNNGITPLMLAAAYGNQVVFHFLIERGADTLARDGTDRTILHWACQGGNVKIVNGILTQNIVDINSNDINEMTPLLLAAYHGKRDVLGLLIEQGADTLAVDEESRNILHHSCTGGHVDTVKYVLNQRIVDINSKDDEEMTPVMLAACHGKREVFDTLVKKGADLSVVNEVDDNILHVACRGGNVKIVNYILMQNIVDINSKDHTCRTPLLQAAYHGKTEVFDILVKKGADLSVVDKDGDNVLHMACYGENARIVKHVLKLNIVNINCRDTDGHTPLLIAAEYSTCDAFELLLESGADPSVVNSDGNNVLHVACQEHNEEIVKHFLGLHVVDINCRGSNGMTPLLLAAEYSACDVFELLLESGADPSVVNSDGNNVLHVACKEHNEEIVKHVLGLHVVDINCRGSNRMTPLLLAAEYSTCDVFELLLESGADPSVVNSDGNNVLHLACMEDNEEIVKHVLGLHVVDINCRGSNRMTPLMLAAEYSTCDVFKLLLESGADPSVVNSDGNNVLHLACMEDNEEIVKHVLGLHVVDINCRGSNRMTPLLLAAEYSTCDVFKLLLESGADPSVVNSDGNNVLHLACMEDNEEIVKHVLGLHVVDINCRGSNGTTPLLLAAEYSTCDVFELLLESGADPSVVNRDGNNALHLACAKGNGDIVKYLLSQSIVDITTKNSQGLNAAVIARENGFLFITRLLLQASKSLHV